MKPERISSCNASVTVSLLEADRVGDELVGEGEVDHDPARRHSSVRACQLQELPVDPLDVREASEDRQARLAVAQGGDERVGECLRRRWDAHEGALSVLAQGRHASAGEAAQLLVARRRRENLARSRERDHDPARVGAHLHDDALFDHDQRGVRQLD
jgi:hypothetical protein